MNSLPIYLTIMVFCVIMSAYFSATETAFSTFSKTKMKALAEKGNKKASLVLRLSENYDKLLSTILIGNNIVNILLASLGTVVFVHYFPITGATISTAVITVTVLIFGEISPKSIAKDMPEKFSMFSAPLLNILAIVLTPINFLFTMWKKLLSLIFKSNDDNKMSQEELIMMVEEVEQDGSIDSDESELLKNVIEVTEKQAKDILTHRVDVEAVPTTASKEEIAKVFTETRFSRLPVYEDTIDKVVGVIHQKDLYINGKMTDKDISELLSPVVFIHEFEQVTDLLKRLQQEKSHMAIVVDEYGGTLGIVTLEDILEELVGEIWDEHDDVVEDIVEISPTSWRINASIGFDKLTDRFGFEDERDDDEFSSVSGWVMDELEKIPEVDDVFEYRGYSVRVDKTDDRRVLEIIMTAPVQEAEEQEQ